MAKEEDDFSAEFGRCCDREPEPEFMVNGRFPRSIHEPRRAGRTKKWRLAATKDWNLGDYRAIARMEDAEAPILVLGIGRGREIYL
jgi:hypothetical protein